MNLNQHKEIVEEVAKFDLDTFGVAGVMQRRADNHVVSMSAELDRAFFAQAAADGTAFSPASGVTAIQEIVESMIQTLETVHNDYVDGVDRSMMDLVLTPAKYGLLRTFLDTQSNPNVDTAGEEFGMYHGVRVYSCTRMPVTTETVRKPNKDHCDRRAADGARRCGTARCGEPVRRPGKNSAVQRLRRKPVL